MSPPPSMAWLRRLFLMKPIHVALCLAAVAAAAGASDPREMDDFKAEVQQLRSEIQEL